MNGPVDEAERIVRRAFVMVNGGREVTTLDVTMAIGRIRWEEGRESYTVAELAQRLGTTPERVRAVLPPNTYGCTDA